MPHTICESFGVNQTNIMSLIVADLRFSGAIGAAVGPLDGRPTLR
jgi:hypothetical protein